MRRVVFFLLPISRRKDSDLVIMVIFIEADKGVRNRPTTFKLVDRHFLKFKPFVRPTVTGRAGSTI